MLPLQVGATIFGISLLTLILAAVWCIVGISLGVWVYRDAPSRRMHAPLWLFIVIITSIIGFIIYLIVSR